MVRISPNNLQHSHVRRNQTQLRVSKPHYYCYISCMCIHLKKKNHHQQIPPNYIVRVMNKQQHKSYHVIVTSLSPHISLSLSPSLSLSLFLSLVHTFFCSLYFTYKTQFNLTCLISRIGSRLINIYYTLIFLHLCFTSIRFLLICVYLTLTCTWLEFWIVFIFILI